MLFLERQENVPLSGAEPALKPLLVLRIHCYSSPLRKYEDGIPGSEIQCLDCCYVVINRNKVADLDAAEWLIGESAAPSESWLNMVGDEDGPVN